MPAAPSLPMQAPAARAVPASEPVRPVPEDIARSLHDVAQLLERGQATTPLSDLARAAARPSPAPVRLALGTETLAQRQHLLQWLMGPAAAGPLAGLSWPPGIELRLETPVFALDAPGATRTEYDDPERFAQAVRAWMPTDEHPAAASGLRLELPPVGGVPLELLVLPPPSRWAEEPETLARLAARPTILVALGPAGPGPLPELAGVWPVSMTHEATPLRAAGAVPVLPATVLGDVHPWSGDGGAARLAAWRELIHARTLADIVDATLERQGEDTARLRGRLKREQRVERGGEAEAVQAQLKTALDQARVKANEDLGLLTATLREHARRALQRSGSLGQTLHALAARVQPEDLVREEAGKVVRLQLDPRQVAGLEGRLAAACRQLLDEQCSLVRDTFELVRRRTEEALLTAGARNLGIPLPPPDAEPLWRAVREGVRLDLRYRGEIARRGLLQRLGAGRQTVFAVLMLLSLVGGFVGFNVRQAAFAGVILLGLFIGAVAWTFRSWREEDRINIEREMDKVRDGVLAELERLSADVARDLQARMQEVLDSAKRDYLGRLDAALREAQAEAGTLADAQRREARSRIKLIEQRDKELANAAATLQKLRTAAAQLGREAQRRWAEACRAAAPAP